MNMSYCQWQNTLSDLRQVAVDFDERLSGDATEPQSYEESAAMARCFDLMRDMLRAADINDDTYDAGEQALATLHVARVTR